MGKKHKKKNKGGTAAATVTKDSSSTDAVVDKDVVKDTASKKSAKKETINFASTILELKAALESAGFKQTEVKAQRFVFEMKRRNVSHRICSVNHARQDSRRKVFTIVVGVPEGLDVKANPFLQFSERGAATSGSKPAFVIRVDRHTLDEHWKGNTAVMIKDVVAVVKSASKLRGVLMDEAAKTAKSAKDKKAKARDDDADKPSASEDESAEEGEDVEDDLENEDFEDDD